MLKQLGLNRLYTPKLEIIGLLENLIVSSRDRGFQPLISPVTLFGDGWDFCRSLIDY